LNWEFIRAFTRIYLFKGKANFKDGKKPGRGRFNQEVIIPEKVSGPNWFPF